jgi:hypothetical protein
MLPMSTAMSTPVRRPLYRHAVRTSLSVLGGSQASLAVLGGSQASLPVSPEYQLEIVSGCLEASIIISSSPVRGLSPARSPIHTCPVDCVPLDSPEHTFRIPPSIPGRPVVLWVQAPTPL